MDLGHAIALDHGNAADLELGHERFCIADGRVGADGDGIEDDAALRALDPVDFRRLLVDREVLVDDPEAALLRHDPDRSGLPAPREDRIQTLRPGVARGPLLGGNLAVLASICGSGYLRAFDGAILFLEEINEYIYRVDRMLSTLKLMGALDKLAGFIFGGDAFIMQIGLGLSFAVLFDAFVIRMTVVPAVMSLLGSRAWWFPSWLDRLVPNVDVEGEQLRALLADSKESSEPTSDKLSV